MSIAVRNCSKLLLSIITIIAASMYLLSSSQHYLFNFLSYYQRLFETGESLRVQSIQNVSRYTGEAIDIDDKCKGMFQIVKRPKKKQTIVWECSKDLKCGGLGDQIRSIVSLFVYANDRNYNFNVLGLEPYSFYPEIFLPNLYDWRNKSTMQNSVKFQWVLNDCEWDLPYKYIRISTSMQFNDNAKCDDWRHDSVRKVMKNWLSDYKPQVRGCGFWYLFKVGPYLDKMLKQHESIFFKWLKTKNYTQIVSIQIRAGDKVLIGHEHPSTELVGKYLTCAKKLEKKLGFEKTVYLLSTDSEELKKSVKNDLIFTTSIIPKHTGIFTTGEKYVINGKNMLAQALVEVIMMAKTNAIIRSHSGFGITAAHLGMMENVYQSTYPECLK